MNNSGWIAAGIFLLLALMPRKPRIPALRPGLNPPRDLNGDGLYEDVNGDGVFDVNDSNDLYMAYIHTPDLVQQYAQYFDFNGNGRVDFADITYLYKLATSVQTASMCGSCR